MRSGRPWKQMATMKGMNRRCRSFRNSYVNWGGVPQHRTPGDGCARNKIEGCGLGLIVFRGGRCAYPTKEAIQHDSGILQVFGCLGEGMHSEQRDTHLSVTSMEQKGHTEERERGGGGRRKREKQRTLS